MLIFNLIISRVKGKYLRFMLDKYWSKSQKNIFKTKFKKKALFITLPITFHLNKNNKWFNRDSLYERDRLIADHLNKKKYQVDIESNQTKKNSIFIDYDLVINSNPYIKSFKTNRDAIIIYLATTSYFQFNNRSEKLRQDKIKNIYNIKLPLKRQIEKINFKIYNQILLVGNEITKNSYPKNIQKKITLISNFPITFPKSCTSNIKKQNINMKKRNFILLGSTKGAMHKGIDIAIEAFMKNKNLNLFIFSKQKNDIEFFNLYKSLIGNNIILYDYVYNIILC